MQSEDDQDRMNRQDLESYNRMYQEIGWLRPLLCRGDSKKESLDILTNYRAFFWKGEENVVTLHIICDA